MSVGRCVYTLPQPSHSHVTLSSTMGGSSPGCDEPGEFGREMDGRGPFVCPTYDGESYSESESGEGVAGEEPRSLIVVVRVRVVGACQCSGSSSSF